MTREIHQPIRINVGSIPEPKESLPQTDAIMKAYRGWNTLEKPNGIGIIDFDLVKPVVPQQFTSRRQVLETLTSFRDSINPVNPQEEFIKAKLNASVYFLRALMGENIPYREYVENITGVTPQIIPEGDILREKSTLADLSKEAGYDPDKESFNQFISKLILSEGFVPGRESFRSFSSGIKSSPEAEMIKNESERCEAQLIPMVLESLGFQGLEFPHATEAAVSRDYWMGWTKTRRGKLLLLYNLYPTWYQGDMEYMTLHEVGGHFVQASLLRRRIVNGEVNPVIGITTVQEPYTFIGEGTADAISYFLPEVEQALSIQGLIARAKRAVRDYVQNNGHIWANEGMDPEKVIEYVMDNDPFAQEDRVRMNVNNWVNNPQRRAYQYVYGISLYWHRQLRNRLSPEKRKAYLRHAMSGYETPSQMMNFADQLTNS
ncbi:MAG: hypothetical protein HY427_02130 [Candidatus Levybacteria bacterium]|nr:hypothetical protein [Candidatus Levybacteria bacterium]